MYYVVECNWGPLHTRLRARDHSTSSTLIWWKRRSQSKFALHYAWWTNRVCECKMDVKSIWIDSYMTSNGPCFMVTWIIFKNHLLEVGQTQNWETMAFGTHTTVDLFYFYHVWGPAWIEIHLNSIWLRARSIWLHTTLEGPWPHYMILGVCWDGLWTLSFGLSQFHGHGSWLVYEVALRFIEFCIQYHNWTTKMDLLWIHDQTFP
jgi:hypothetical protein